MKKEYKALLHELKLQRYAITHPNYPQESQSNQKHPSNADQDPANDQTHNPANPEAEYSPEHDQQPDYTQK